jgi:sugar phosphate permease
MEKFLLIAVGMAIFGPVLLTTLTALGWMLIQALRHLGEQER